MPLVPWVVIYSLVPRVVIFWNTKETQNLDKYAPDALGGHLFFSA